MRRNKFFQKIFYNWQIKILCFLVAVFAYFVLGLVLQETRTVQLPLEITLPEDYKADSNIPTSVDLVIKGSQDQIYMLDIDYVKVSVDFSSVDHEGVSVAPVVIRLEGPNGVVDTSSVSISTNPMQVKIYFSLKNSAENSLGSSLGSSL